MSEEPDEVEVEANHHGSSPMFAVLALSRYL